MEEIRGTVYEMERDLDEENFELFVDAVLEGDMNSLISDGEVNATVRVIKDHKLFDFTVPIGRQQAGSFMVDIANAMKPADAYVFITEAWALDVPAENKDAIMHYALHPEALAENPFKSERLIYEGHGFGMTYAGYIKVERDDRGNIVVGERIIDDETSHTSGLMNAADLLLPMLD